jgi:uncharacterized membrane protein
MPTIQFLRSFRFGEYAYFDIFVSFLGIYLLSPLLSKLFLKLKLKISRKSWLLLTLPLSIIVHILVKNVTPMTRDFLDFNGHYVLKGVILILTILGVKDIKRKKK